MGFGMKTNYYSFSKQCFRPCSLSHWGREDQPSFKMASLGTELTNKVWNWLHPPLPPSVGVPVASSVVPGEGVTTSLYYHRKGSYSTHTAPVHRTLHISPSSLTFSQIFQGSSLPCGMCQALRHTHPMHLSWLCLLLGDWLLFSCLVLLWSGGWDPKQSEIRSLGW